MIWFLARKLIHTQNVAFLRFNRNFFLILGSCIARLGVMGLLRADSCDDHHLPFFLALTVAASDKDNLALVGSHTVSPWRALPYRLVIGIRMYQTRLDCVTTNRLNS